MALEHRGNRKYYYRSRRVNGRVIKEYVGSGAEAEEAHRRDAEARKRDEEFRDYMKENERIELMMQIVDICIEVLMEATMTAAGYHRTNGGPWRKKRVKKSEDRAGLAAPPPILPQSG